MGICLPAGSCSLLLEAASQNSPVSPIITELLLNWALEENLFKGLYPGKFYSSKVIKIQLLFSQSGKC